MGEQGPQDQEPDYRFTLANERTFLAWMRTALALLAGAVAVVQFAPDVGSDSLREICAVALALLAAAGAGGGLWRWQATQRAMRRGGHLSTGLLPVGLAVGLTLVSLAVLAALVLDRGR